MTAIQTVEAELRLIQRKQQELMDDRGYVRCECRRKYYDLVKQAREYKGSLEFLKRMKGENHDT